MLEIEWKKTSFLHDSSEIIEEGSTVYKSNNRKE
jgi:hypothetical protein